MLFSHERRAPRHSGKQPRPRNARLRVETLEDRTTPYVLSGFKWSNPNLTFSFMPDGTAAEGATSTLFSLLNATIPTATWEREIARALQTWADSSTLNFRLVTDPNGDIRIGAVPQGGSLAYAYYPTGGDA
ncbi:MAG TPA: hypothetical protein VKD90_16045, partial [Gemmataceae bacterium]|nr:hypothetical protein [Gemmataceae bacterium]